MEIKQQETDRKGFFYIEEDGKILAKMTYMWAGDRIIIDHTEVDDILRGKSAGKLMLAKAVAYAREKGIKILPLCPFAKSVFDKTTEYADIL